MNIIIFSDNKKISESFKGIIKTKEHSISFNSMSGYNRAIKSIEKNSIVYFDVSSLTNAEATKTIKNLAKLDGSYFGIIDQKGIIKDIAELFHIGAAEYINKDLLKKGLTIKRFENILDFLSIDKKDRTHKKSKKIDKSGYILSGSNWEKIKKGKEYTFCLMFIELDNQKKIKEKYGRNRLMEYMTAFHDTVTNLVENINGKVWMWMDFGGLVLIPFDGKKCDAILTGFKLILNRNIISIENSYEMLLSYRIALHIGNTIYQPRGKTGGIVSDSINSIFHLGQKFTNKGNFTLTENIFEFLPDGLADCFRDEGEFEGREIKSMIKPVK